MFALTQASIILSHYIRYEGSYQHDYQADSCASCVSDNDSTYARLVLLVIIYYEFSGAQYIFVTS